MSDPPTRRAPPGWYAEQGQRGFRYWDGENWAEPMSNPVGLLGAGSGDRPSAVQLRTGLALLGAALALLVAGLLFPWADASGRTQGVLDGDIPWLVSPGGVADSWLLVVLTAVMFWALLVATLAGNTQRIWLTAVLSGVVVMGFCVAEGLAIDDDLDLSEAKVGLGLFLSYAGGASAAVGGMLVRSGQ